MARLPEKNVLSGSKNPKTTTGEMKDALGKLRDYLNDLLGDDSADKEGARQALGIDLTGLTDKIAAKADGETIETAIQVKADKTELDSKVKELEEAIARRGIPVGTIEYFATAAPPAGYLIANGAAVGRETYPELFAAIGITFGEGDGTSTFNLPDLIDRFPQGSTTQGKKIDAGLPNISGGTIVGHSFLIDNPSGVFSSTNAGSVYTSGGSIGTGGSRLVFDASTFNSIYGASNTVQPPALTLLPCIKAFDAATHPGLIDMTGMANEIAGKLDRNDNGTAVKYVTETFGDGVNWYRKWSDGWVEQGGVKLPNITTITFNRPFANTNYYFNYDGIRTASSDSSYHWHYNRSTTQVNVLLNIETTYWYACGYGL